MERGDQREGNGVDEPNPSSKGNGLLESELSFEGENPL